MRTLLILPFAISLYAQAGAFVIPTNGSNYREHGASSFVDQNAPGFTAPEHIAFRYLGSGTSAGGIGAVTNGTLFATKLTTSPCIQVLNSLGPLWNDGGYMTCASVSTPVIDANGKVCAIDSQKIACWNSGGTLLQSNTFGASCAPSSGCKAMFSLYPTPDGTQLIAIGGGPILTFNANTLALIGTPLWVRTPASISAPTTLFNGNPTSGGSSYVSGDVGKKFTLACGAKGVIQSVSGGQVQAVYQPATTNGTGCSTGTGETTTCSTCTGSGLTVQVTMIAGATIAPGSGTVYDFFHDTNDACSVPVDGTSEPNTTIYYVAQNTNLDIQANLDPNTQTWSTCQQDGGNQTCTFDDNAVFAVSVSSSGVIETAEMTPFVGPSQASPMCHAGIGYTDSGNGTAIPGLVAFSTTPSGTSLTRLCAVATSNSTGTSHAWIGSLGLYATKHAGETWVDLRYPATSANITAGIACTIAKQIDVSNMSSVCLPFCKFGSEMEIVPRANGDQVMLGTVSTTGNYSAQVAIDVTACLTACPTAPMWSYPMPQYTDGNVSASGQVVVGMGSDGLVKLVWTSNSNGAVEAAGPTILSDYPGNLTTGGNVKQGGRMVKQ